jgi:histidinol-phosphate aminotransferase
MALSRRNFLQRTAAGAGAAALLQFPLAPRLFASPEPRRMPRPDGAILLNSNENPYGPLPSAAKSMHETLAKANRYPDPDGLAERIARYNHVTADQVMLGTGSTEVLRACAQAFTGPGKNIVVASPTFEALVMFAEATGAETRRVPLTASYAHDLGAMAQRVDSNTGIIYICNPNNPTASITPAKDIDAFLGKIPGNATVVIDEAYHHFAMGQPDYRSFMDHAGDRVIIARTFSKIYGMAGMRLGYAVASKATIDKISAFQLIMNMNMVTISGAMASLDDDAAMMFAAQRNAADRAEFVKQAEARKVAMVPSYANFAMVKTGRPVKEMMAAFKQQGVLIGRPFPPMLEWVRVTFGLPEEMKAFWQAWDKTLAS